MNKILKLNSYSQYDELGDRDYMIYEVEYDDGHKEYVSRDMFRNLKALEIIKKKIVDIRLLFETFNYYKNGLKAYNAMRTHGYELTQEEYNSLKEVML